MRGHWKTALGVGLSVGLLVYVLRDVDFGRLWVILRSSRLDLFVASALVATTVFALRAIRWQLILDPVAEHLPMGMLWRSTAIGMMVNNVYPARLGELARAYALTRETDRVPFAAAFASLAVDRMFDAFVLLGLMLIGMRDLPMGSVVGGRSVQAIVVSGGVLLAALAAMLYLLVFFPTTIIRIYEAFARRVAPRIERGGRELLIAFAAGLGVLRSPVRFALVLFWTVAHWLVQAAAFWIGFRAVRLDDLSYSAALFAQGIIAIGVSVPGAPGYFGQFEIAGRLALELFGVPNEQAVAWGLGFHILSFIPITVIGLYYFARLGLHFRDVRAVATSADNEGAPASGETTPRP